MGRITLTKASLSRQKGLLKTYGAVLPSLDLKRRQISAERARARRQLQVLEERCRELEAEVARVCPMLAHEHIRLEGLARVVEVRLSEENLIGTRLPRVEAITVAVAHYGLLSLPFWVDHVVGCLREALETQVRLQVARERIERLVQAERTVTQRFNLFDKVLIPRTRSNIRSIAIYLSDADRAGVVNSKLAKRKKERAQTR
ncbi:V-type ATP synthase subunit D [Cyanobium sp. ATX 6A2]|uniref:V-type ATP synthase subunit D n=1 Tax=Cyanobium sp. ATX 6A2 TaxID=2823700 RepID=UPI0020CCAD55|nr:V-type ATP synthase subunit D [Cyanobium sp. ATX 6A2]MCP9888918.1 V-type ATP synthase subunit D [Cyanobium sp. ATX 6A2]